MIVIEPLETPVTRGVERSNLGKFLGKVEYLLKLRFAIIKTSSSPRQAVLLKAFLFEGFRNCCIENCEKVTWRFCLVNIVVKCS